jgi:hypothetical protein
MEKTVDSYKIGKIQVTITETENPDRLKVECNDGTFRSEFSVRRYEYMYYKRHMNQKIKNAFKAEYENEKGD